MAHFANIDKDNIVRKVVVVPDAHETRGQAYLNELGFEGTWIQCSFNGNVRGRFAGIGMVYYPEMDVFARKKRYESWVWDDSVLDWAPPVSMPEDGQEYDWSEETQEWVLRLIQNNPEGDEPIAEDPI